ncbi:MAG: hypothetical protein BroJett018_05980 [Chloroflexota bacterium]|nr:hypothetical protein [Chloroflexota bacterium]NOG62994.1 hypothetical protein [Chloroflexota bacterium]GIK62804.1 MAG: hypothetical protein BroJett018_05980 [Chloroflexota bacterium]
MCRLYTKLDEVSIPQKCIIEEIAIFYEDTQNASSLETYAKIKEALTDEEREVINKFLLGNHLFKFADRRRKK